MYQSSFRNFLCLLVAFILVTPILNAQSDTTKVLKRKNIIRYNLSSALLFGPDKALILGYERVLNYKRSISINAGTIALPKITNIQTDSFTFNKDLKNTGFNLSLDYRFYLRSINRFDAPRGVYIGPWYSFNQFKRENAWEYRRSTSNKELTVDTKFNIHSLGVEMGYQFVFWDRLALDMVLIGPGLGIYNVKSVFDTNLTNAEREQIGQAISQALSQKFPGMDFVFDGDELDANGVLKTTSVGFRYLIHVGFRF